MHVLEARVDRLEAALQRLAEAQAQTQVELRALAEAQRRTEQRLEALTARVEALAEAQWRTEQRLEALTARVDALTARVDALTARVDDLTARVATLTARVDALTARVDTLAGQLSELVVQVSRLAGILGDVRGRVLELDYREKAHSYFLRILRGIRPVTRMELAAMAEDAEQRALLSLDEHADLLQADVVVRGRRRDRDEECYLLAEVSAVIDAHDVERAARRARLLERIAAVPALAAVAGERATADASREAAAAGVWLVVDGRAFPPGSPPES
jgi:chromosome segregation ATPase